MMMGMMMKRMPTSFANIDSKVLNTEQVAGLVKARAHLRLLPLHHLVSSTTME